MVGVDIGTIEVLERERAFSTGNILYIEKLKFRKALLEDTYQ